MIDFMIVGGCMFIAGVIARDIVDYARNELRENAKKRKASAERKRRRQVAARRMDNRKYHLRHNDILRDWVTGNG